MHSDNIPPAITELTHANIIHVIGDSLPPPSQIATLVTTGAATTGVSPIAAREDHAHDIPAGLIITGMLAAGAVTGTKIASATITDSNIAGNTITSASIKSVVKAYTAAGGAVSGVNTTATTVATLSLPAQPVAGLYVLLGYSSITKTVSGDDFRLRLMDGATMITDSISTFAQTSIMPVVIGTLSVAASTAKTITTQLIRAAGTGNGSTPSDTRYNFLIAIWIPS